MQQMYPQVPPLNQAFQGDHPVMEAANRYPKGQGGRHARWTAQKQMQESSINHMKNNEITKREPPWTDVTTVMMRNLPNKYTQQMLLEELHMSGFRLQHDFDFFYLPMDHSNAVNLGYCFINFVETPVANAFAATFQGKRMRRFNSSKTVVVMPASIQGYERNYAYYASTRVAQAEDPQYRPLFVRPAPLQEGYAEVHQQYVHMVPVWDQQQQQPPPVLSYKDWHGQYCQPAPLQQAYDYDTDEEREQWERAGPYPPVATLPAAVAAVPGGALPAATGGCGDDFATAQAAADAAAEVLAPAPGQSAPFPESLYVARANRLFVRNTFLDAPPERSPSVERHFEERQVKSCPVSVPQSEAGSARIEAVLSRRTSLDTAQVVHSIQGADKQPRLEVATVVAAANCLAKEINQQGRTSGADSSSSSRTTRSVSAASPNAGLQQPGGSSCGSVDLHTDTTPSEMDGPALGSPELPCKGSVLHRWGACKPCAFFQGATEDKGGCKNGVECTFCHLCEPGEKKRRKKERQAIKRESRERRADLLKRG